MASRNAPDATVAQKPFRKPGLTRSRALAFALALAIELLFLLALLGLFTSPDAPPRRQGELVALNLPGPKAETAKAERSKAAAAPKRVTAEPKKTLPVLPTPPIPTPNMVVVSKEDFAASDIGKLARPAAPGGASGSKGAYGPGEGPGGQTLYPAEWYREPSRGELASYLPNGAPPGSWAMIACRTIERNQVENCVGLGQSHAGLSAAMRQAAWQFRVLPPRVDGRPLIGAWVRIRFDFTEPPPN
ncbi:MAG: hypothetical protein ACKVOP_12500 [Sphingomonadaceae bacterium]